MDGGRGNVECWKELGMDTDLMEYMIYGIITNVHIQIGEVYGTRMMEKRSIASSCDKVNSRCIIKNYRFLLHTRQGTAYD
jgi:hypothetical protein